MAAAGASLISEAAPKLISEFSALRAGADFQRNDSGFGPESQSHRPKVGVTGQKSELQPGRPPESEPNRPEKAPEWGLGASTENTP